MASQVLGRIYMAQGRHEEAEDILQRVLNEQRQQMGDADEHTQESIKRLIALYEVWNKPEEAERWRAKLLADGTTNGQSQDASER
jgi:hypothetical protein